METIFVKYYKSPVGELIIGSFKDEICLADWRYRKMRDQIDQRIQKGCNAIYKESSSPIIEECINQFNEYFNKKRTQFDIPLKMIGTDFQQQVWKTLQTIDYGKTNTYLDLSKQLNNEKAIRAVASTNGANAISIMVPCHRIIGSKGELVGYAGGLETKQKLILLENKGSIPDQLTLFK